MTFLGPTIRDYPDFMQPDGAATAAVLDQAVGATGLADVLNVDVSSWPMTRINFSKMLGPAGLYQVQLTWFTTINVGLGAPVVHKEIFFTDNGFHYYTFPNFGSRLLISVVPPNLINPWQIQFNVTLTGSVDPLMPPFTHNQENAMAIAAGGRATFALMIHGNCRAEIISANSGLGFSVCELWVMNSAGVFQIYETVTADATETLKAKEVKLLPGELQISSNNRAGVIQNIVAGIHVG